jgi:hypothetical protein
LPVTNDSQLEIVTKQSATNNSDHERVAAVVQLANRQLATLEADIAKQTDEQLADLEERLAVAERLTASAPEQAAAMYRAIVDLYDEFTWADSIVSEARRRLANVGDHERQD